MRPPIFSPSIARLSGRPKPEVAAGARGRRARRPAAPRRHGQGGAALIEETTLTYHQIARRTGVSLASISRWTKAGEWKRPLFAPISMPTVPTPRATAYNKRRRWPRASLALADRYVRELEETPTIDLDKLGQALELRRMARLAAMRRTPRRADAAMWGEPMRPIAELCGEGVDILVRRARRSTISLRIV